MNKKILKEIIKHCVALLSGLLLGFVTGCSWYGTGVGLTYH